MQNNINRDWKWTAMVAYEQFLCVDECCTSRFCTYPWTGVPETSHSLRVRQEFDRICRIFLACRTSISHFEDLNNMTYHWLIVSPLDPPIRNICIDFSDSRNKFPFGVFITTAHIDDVSWIIFWSARTSGSSITSNVPIEFGLQRVESFNLKRTTIGSPNLGLQFGSRNHVT